MATSYNDHPNAVTVGNYFAKQYYGVLQNNPNFGHQFYTDASSIIRIDGELKEQSSTLLQIHMLIVSLNFTAIEIKTVNSLESLSGGILVVVSGSVKSPTFAGWRNFVQTFLLSPQEKGYFVLNDIFHFVSDEVIHQNPTPRLDNGADYQRQAPILSENRVDYLNSAPLLQGGIINYQHQHPAPILQEDRIDYQQTEPIDMENPVDSQLNNSSPHSESPDVPENEVDASEHYVFVNKEGDDHVDSYSVQDQQQQEVPVIEVKETPVENSTSFLNEVDSEKEPPPALVEESTGEPQNFSYASILRAPKVKTAPLLAVYYPKKVSSPAVYDRDQKSQLDSKRTNSTALVPDSTVEPAEEGFSQEGESKSVYVKNLPHTVSTPDIQQEFEKFGKIKPDGVFIKNRKELGVCFAFVEFVDIESVQNAIKASPVQLAGRQVYIEERRPSSISTSNYSRGGGRRGRGRGYQNESLRGRFGGRSFGRGNNQEGSDNYKPTGNGVRGSY